MSSRSRDVMRCALVLASVCRHWWAKAVWLVWPLWVWFSVMATGNHFWLDVLAGVVLATASLAVVYRGTTRRIIAKLL